MNTTKNSGSTNITSRNSYSNDKASNTLKEQENIIQISTDTAGRSKTENQDDTTIEVSQAKTKRNSIYIIGEQHTSGLWNYIINNREHKWHDRYNIISFVKPNALSSEAYKTLTTIESALTPGDRVILSVGANDNNPYMLLNQIGRILDKLQHVKVYVVPVYRNRQLCTSTINNEIACLIKIYKNCYFLKYEEDYNNLKKFLTFAANKINYYLNYENYYNTYLTFNKQILLRKSEKPYHCKRQKKIIQSKITNYFNSIKQYNFIYTPVKSNNNNLTIPQKGTIPYYFNIRHNNHTKFSDATANTITNPKFFRKKIGYSTPKHC